MSSTKIFPVRGYFILRTTPQTSYRGVDRDHFEPLLVMEDFDADARLSFTSNWENVWGYCREKWRRQTYILYEKHRVLAWGDDYLLENKEVGQTIITMLEPYLGAYELVESVIFTSDQQVDTHFIETSQIFGYDIAYAGGDYYSAVYNGLLHQYHSPRLLMKYGTLLNAYGLFDTVDVLEEYQQDFKNEVITERNSQFCLYHLCSHTSALIN